MKEETQQEHPEECEVKPDSSSVLPLTLQPNSQLLEAKSYSLADLLRYHDRVFVENVFKAVTGRKASERELDQTLDQLRSGRLSKTEIIDSLIGSHKSSEQRITGLPSKTLRTVSGWPVIGYLLRVLRGLIKLPVIMQDQQRFEAYALAQQQQIADYLNKNVLPLVRRRSVNNLVGPLNTNTTRDVVETVIMLSDSLLELSENQRLLDEKIESLTKALQSISDRVEVQSGDLQSRIQDLQAQQEKSEAQLHSNLLGLTEATKALQEMVVSLQQQLNENVVAQREFLVQEQNLIVTAQKLALKDFEERLANDTHHLGVELKHLKDLLEQLRSGLDQTSAAESPPIAEELEKA